MGKPESAELAIRPALAQTLLNYLAGQPYREVYQLIEALRALQPLAPGGKAKRKE